MAKKVVMFFQFRDGMNLICRNAEDIDLDRVDKKKSYLLTSENNQMQHWINLDNVLFIKKEAQKNE